MLRVDRTGRIAEDLPCQACGYNLRGHAEGDRCSECGAPVSRSVRRDLLKHADPAWLGRLALGTRLAVTGLIGVIVVDFAGYGLIAQMPPATGALRMTLMNGAGLLRAGLVLTFAAGGWLLTSPEPGRVVRESAASARRIVRWCLAVVIAWTLLRAIGPDGAAGPAWPVRSLANLIAAAAGLVYLRTLVGRIPHESLARHARIVMWGYVPCQAAAVVAGLVVMIFIDQLLNAGPAGTLPPAAQVCRAMSIVVGLGAMSFGVLGLSVLIRSARAFGRTATAARAAWDGNED
jgi:hypothetical protein